MTEPKNAESQMRCSEDAERRFQIWKDKDPYPCILPALLNSADIHDYIETTGMIYPYDPRRMKSSSYEAHIGEYAHYWDESGKQKSVKLTEMSSVGLNPNSLVFFETKEEFRLPSYIAIRFNLRITNVHRGLLLGTGPLVDPGFKGKLLIPIHNLTNNQYRFFGNEPFIWVEFTKVSRNGIWHQDLKEKPEQVGVFEPFPDDKIDRRPSDYFRKANDGNRIQNAIPEALNAAKNQAERAEKAVRIFSGLGIVGAVVAAVGFYPLITESVSLSKDVSKTIADFQNKYRTHLTKEANPQTKFEVLNKKILDLKLDTQAYESIDRQQIQLDALEEKIRTLQKELELYKAQRQWESPLRQKRK